MDFKVKASFLALQVGMETINCTGLIFFYSLCTGLKEQRINCTTQQLESSFYCEEAEYIIKTTSKSSSSDNFPMCTVLYDQRQHELKRGLVGGECSLFKNKEKHLKQRVRVKHQNVDPRDNESLYIKVLLTAAYILQSRNKFTVEFFDAHNSLRQEQLI